MKSKWNLSLCILFLVVALMSCRVLPGSESIPAESTLPPEEVTPMASQADAMLSTVTDIPSATPTPFSTDTPTPGLPVFTNPVIFTLNMFTPVYGWALTQDHDRLLRTVDGGSTWLDATPAELHPLPPNVASLWIEAFFLDAQTAWFTPNSLDGVLYQTRDGGVQWTTTAIPFERARYDFLDENTGVALVDLGAGAGSHYVAIYRTLDGGASWTMVFTHEPGESKSLREGGSKNGITFRDVDFGWVGGVIPMEDYFYLFYMEDGGATWAQETDIALPGDFSGSVLDVWQPVLIDANNAILPVRAYAPGGGIYLLVYRSDDGGETWAYRGSVENGEAAAFINADEGYMAAGEALYQTLDGGATWTAVSSSGIPAGEIFLSIEFVDSQHGWALSTPDSSTWEPLMLHRTVDGGVSWSLLLP